MESPVITICLVTVLGLCQGMVLVGEDKRQGLIPFPRVGRTYNPWLQSSVFRPDLDDDDGLNIPEDIFSVRYTRGLFTPRLGRRKRSADEEEQMENRADTLQDMAPYFRLVRSVDLDNRPEDTFSVRNTRGLFNPRLGREKRSADDEKTSESSAHSFGANGNVLDLGELLRRTPWAIVAYKDGVDKKMAFSPRLGRAMAPRLGRKRSDGTSDALDTDKRAAFAPRLGRGYSMEDGDTSPFEIATRAAFSPRLGRAGQGYVHTRSAFAPRLGRSDSNINDPNSRDTTNQSV